MLGGGSVSQLYDVNYWQTSAVRGFLIEIAKAGGTCWYGDIYNLMDWESPMLGPSVGDPKRLSQILVNISERESKEGSPPLNCLVYATQTKRRISDGYVSRANSSLEKVQQDTFDFWRDREVLDLLPSYEYKHDQIACFRRLTFRLNGDIDISREDLNRLNDGQIIMRNISKGLCVYKVHFCFGDKAPEELRIVEARKVNNE